MPVRFGLIAASCLLAACQGGGDIIVVDLSAGGAGGSTLGSGGFSGSSGGAVSAGTGGVSTVAGGAAGSQNPTGGFGGQAGGAGSAGAAAGGTAGSAPSIPCEPWPPGTTTEEVDDTIEVDGVYDGGFKRLIGVGPLGGGGQEEDQPAFFRLAPGSTLKNVILGGPAADGVHCSGTCRLENVWWEDVGEDAATLDGDSSSQVMTIECAGARHAADKVFQHNGPGTMVIRNVVAEDFNKLYRSCGNCEEQFTRHVVLDDITVEGGQTLVGVNENYGDTAQISNITVEGGITVCLLYEGNDTGAEPSIVGEGPDPVHCPYDDSEIN